MNLKIVMSLVPICAGLIGGAVGSVVTVHYMAPDPLEAARDDQAPVRAQARRDIDNMRQEFRNRRPSSAASNWHEDGGR